MNIYLKNPDFSGQRLAILAISGFLMAGFPIFGLFVQKTEAEPLSADFATVLSLIEGNTLISFSNPHNPGTILAGRKIPVIITAYSSSVWETDDTPTITAAGTSVRDGIIANNMLPFGTEVVIPELYGDKVFVVEDRMHRRKGNYHFDIWFPSYLEAKNFGARTTYIEVL